MGLGAQAATTDILSFSRGVGLFGGISAEGSVIHPDSKRNSAYYGKSVSASDILVQRSVQNASATELVAKISAAATPK